ncbi:MAG: alkaline phosphatase family protein [Lautropia sp.]
MPTPDAPAAPGDALPLVLAGPILRRCTPGSLVLWLALTRPATARITLRCDDTVLAELDAADPRGADRPGADRPGADRPGADHGRPDAGSLCARRVRVGAHLHLLLLELTPAQPLPSDRWIDYALSLRPDDAGPDPQAGWLDASAWAPDLCHAGRAQPCFRLAPRVRSVLHGSCRKPHFDGGDGLARADRLLAALLADGATDGAAKCAADGKVDGKPDGKADGAADDRPASMPDWPSALVLTGDQVYMDDVAGPMLRAIHGLVARLGLPVECLPGPLDDGLADSDDLYAHPAGYYRRETLLPRRRRNRALIDVLFRGVEKPVFTSASAHNHLITLGEMVAMVLLAWSPQPWRLVDLAPPASLDRKARRRYARERRALEGFVSRLAPVRRLFAHLPVAMIFDDHDISDDWNLSGEWEDVAYGHPFSRRVIGNALIAYALCQGWGNQPEAFDDALLGQLQCALDAPGSAAHELAITRLLAFRRWHFTWPTVPPLMAIDSRSRRWRSSSDPRRPSGLLDWQGLTDLQQALRGHEAVLLVSPAPIFGVKLIEAIQRVFSWLGLSLMVDAENWMAHRGCAYTVLNIFRHPETPRHFVILSGDVHYSFVYDVALRDAPGGPRIWQICSSGLRNAFPPRLLALLDHANRWLYSPRSPLNALTRRRRMRVTPRKPLGTPHGRRLLGGGGVGLVELDPGGQPWRIRQLLDDGTAPEFVPREAESRWG